MLSNILLKSRRNNARSDVTGMLLVWENNFMQALEGEKELVEETFSRISADRRHHMISVLLRHDVAERSFSNWAMELGSLHQLPKEHQALAAQLWRRNRIHTAKGAERTAVEIILDSFRSCRDRLEFWSTERKYPNQAL